MALTPEQQIAQQRQAMLTASPGPLVDPRQQAIDNGYRPGSGFMYEDKFYASGNPGRISMDQTPLERLLIDNPAAKAAFEAGGNQMVMNPNPNPQMGPRNRNPQNMDNQIAVHNIDDQGNITGQTGLGRAVARYGNISDLDSFSPELQAAIQGYQNPTNTQGGGLYPNEIGTQGLEYFTADFDHLQNPTNSQNDEGRQVGSGTGMPAGINDIYQGPIGLKRTPYSYEGDSPFSDIFNDFYGSGGGSGPMTADSSYNPFTGTYGSSSQRGEMYDFISGAFGDMQDQMTNKMVKSPEFMDRFNMYGDAMNTYNDYQSEQEKQNQLRMPGAIYQPITGDTTERPFPLARGGPKIPEFITGGTAPDGSAQLPGPIMDPNITPFDPQPSMPDFNTGTGDNTTDVFGAGNNPINNNPITVMPSPITPPGGMNSGHSHGDLLSGIGKLFEQYFPNQGGGNNQFNQPGAQPTFDAAGNSASGGQTQSNQVFGNMITPDFGNY